MKTYVLEEDSNFRPVYIGYALRGAALGDAAWIVEYFVYVDGRFLGTLVSDVNQIANNYATLSYS